MAVAAQGLTLKVHPGAGAALLAFDVDEALKDDLAGFAVTCAPPTGAPFALTNRLTFDQPIVRTTTPQERQAITTDTHAAPLQTFHWSHFPHEVTAGTFAYTATAMLFRDGSETEIEPGPQCTTEVELVSQDHPRFGLGFTRGYVSSQAYVDRFHNAGLAPSPETTSYDTTPFRSAYEWLGFDARAMVFAFLEEVAADPTLELDVFAYDFNEPDVIAGMERLGSRLRLFLDDSASHVASASASGRHVPLEVDTKARLTRSAGAANVRTGHFARFSHSKVFIQRRGDQAVRVLAGSANFSVRGLYVQSNSVFTFDSPDVAGLYEQAFQQAWTQPLSRFDTSPIAAQWFEQSGDGLPDCAICLSPHADASVSLGRVAQSIANAKSSVLFAIMEIGSASGPVVAEIERLPQRPELYAFGTTQRLDGSLRTTSPTDPSSPFIPFDYLKAKVPPPFQAEVSGGAGQVIHHKFVVCDFNDADPVVYAGSSNLAAGGEEQNGDNLVELRDPLIASAYAVQAIQLVDHYRFRSVQHAATTVAPLRLRTRSEQWAAPFFDPSSPRCRERILFAR